MPDDYLGRLLARHAPPMPRDGLPGADGERRVLIKPRPAGPFERVEALRAAPAEPDEPAPLLPQAPSAAVFEGGQVRYERELRTTTERETVVRGAAPRQDGTGFAVSHPPAAEPLLRPAAIPGPGPLPPAGDRARPERPTRRPGEDGDTPAAASRPAPRDPDVPPRAVAPALRPRTDAPPAARDTARATAGGRRGQRPAERVVHVQIGRLEVSAAGPERPAAAGRPARAERPGPSLSLADYLSRDEKRN